MSEHWGVVALLCSCLSRFFSPYCVAKSALALMCFTAAFFVCVSARVSGGIAPVVSDFQAATGMVGGRLRFELGMEGSLAGAALAASAAVGRRDSLLRA